MGHNNPLSVNLEILDSLVRFAYQNGYHELGYDIVAEVRSQVETSVERGYTSTISDGPPILTSKDIEAMQAVIQALWSHKQSVKLDALVDRFLNWPLPKSVCADMCVTDRNYEFPRSGTNLLDANEARAMLSYVLQSPLKTRAEWLAEFDEKIRAHNAIELSGEKTSRPQCDYNGPCDYKGAETNPQEIYVQIGWVPWHPVRGISDSGNVVERDENRPDLSGGWEWAPAYAAVKSPENGEGDV